MEDLREKAVLSMMFLRAKIVRLINPADLYNNFVRTTIPLSRKFAFDRGIPIDRFYIEQFVSKNADKIKGVCLEIGDNRYTRKYGGDKVHKSDVLDVNKKNRLANIYSDLRSIKKVADNTYDCLIMTQVIGMIDDIFAVISEAKRILKKDGYLILTCAALSPSEDPSASYWRFAKGGVRYLLSKYFAEKNIKVESFGNALSSPAFFMGLSQEDLGTKELQANDQNFPCIIAATARK